MKDHDWPMSIVIVVVVVATVMIFTGLIMIAPGC